VIRQPGWYGINDREKGLLNSIEFIHATIERSCELERRAMISQIERAIIRLEKLVKHYGRPLRADGERKAAITMILY
jgi:hypothetical protein